jgi:cell division protein FtsN
VTSPQQRISARDYKHGGGRRHGRFDIRHTEFLAGLGVGLVIALVVFFVDHRTKAGDAAAVKQPRVDKEAAADAPPPAAPETTTEQYEYYDKLPKFEVVIPDQQQKRGSRHDLPTAPIERPGVYVIQVGSYKDQSAADRQRLKLGKLGIETNVQRVAVDEDVRQRVSIGPMRDLDKLNALRRQLRAADVDDALVVRLGD